MRHVPRSSQVFVLESGGRGVMAFEAFSGNEARSLAQEHWVVEELKKRGLYVPTRQRTTGLRVRVATAEEAAVYAAAKPPIAANDDGDLFTVMLP